MLNLIKEQPMAVGRDMKEIEGIRTILNTRLPAVLCLSLRMRKGIFNCILVKAGE